MLHYLQEVCHCSERLLRGSAAEGRALVWRADKSDVAQVQHSGHSAQHSFALGLRDAHDGHSIQRGAQALSVVHIRQRIAGLRAGRRLVEVPEARHALLQPIGAGRHLHASLRLKDEEASFQRGKVSLLAP